MLIRFFMGGGLSSSTSQCRGHHYYSCLFRIVRGYNAMISNTSSVSTQERCRQHYLSSLLLLIPGGVANVDEVSVNDYVVVFVVNYLLFFVDINSVS